MVKKGKSGIFLEANREAKAKLYVTAAAKQTTGQKDDPPDQFQDPAYGDTNNAEGQQQEPDDGIQNQGQQRQRPTDENQRPTDEKKKAPHKKGQHNLMVVPVQCEINGKYKEYSVLWPEIFFGYNVPSAPKV